MAVSYGIGDGSYVYVYVVIVIRHGRSPQQPGPRVCSVWEIADSTLAIEAVHGALDVVIVGVMPPLIAARSSACSGISVSRFRFSLRDCFFMAGLTCSPGRGSAATG